MATENVHLFFKYLLPFKIQQLVYIFQKLMLNIAHDIPLKETLKDLSRHPRFSLIQKIEPVIFDSSVQASIKAAQIIKDTIKEKNSKGEPCVLGLATGSTPLRVYKELIKMYENGEVSFKNVVTFNLDEYYPIAKDNVQSYYFYMHDNLFNHIDIPKENINIPDGEIERDKVTQFCDQYQKKIKSYGGIDLQVLGIGRTGHIGFNQPPSPVKSITRLVYLHRLTRKDAANAFGGIEKVPKCAITMGIQTISKAKRIIIMAWSESKAPIVKQAIQGEKTNEIPSTFLHDHSNAVFFIDKGAGQLLSRFNIPWTIKGDIEDPNIPKTKYWILKMIIWLCKMVNKSILRLTFQDYEDHELSWLVMDCAHGKVQDLNLYAYKQIIHKITGWPIGGRKNEIYNVQEGHILDKVSIKPKKVLIFSPHPDDDVISMGGTLKRLVEQGHKVSVAYMVTGSNAVHDYQAQKYLHFLEDFLAYNPQVQQCCKVDPKFRQQNHYLIKIVQQGERNLKQKKEREELSDAPLVRHLKGIIRNSEAKIAVNSLGIEPKNVYALELPFYTHHSKRKEATSEDQDIVRDLLKIVQPDAIYAAGDLTDPHGTHRKCLEIILKVVDHEHEKAKHYKDYVSLAPPCEDIYFYRGAWQEWEIPIARKIVPMSPFEVQTKVQAILKHQSQKDNPMFPGEDKRQFWVRSKERNRSTAQLLNNLGLPNYQAAEVFVNLHDLRKFDSI